MVGNERNRHPHTENSQRVSAVLRVIGEHDPEGLLDIGAPADEYMPEAAHFARLMSENHTMTAALVTEVWTHWFGSGSQLVTAASAQELEQLATQLETVSSAGRPGPNV